ncbi:hypothetical protein COLO4_02148 [Corchorus olitorius]|uniref:Uncharacterized protein n=1 Tax=Corchorus olitorius TaxID=93759 RepID=A0A1R3L1F0_9ROSI|nr:hypothetical protein COLO4_02148 [Corchorus olitorius]
MHHRRQKADILRHFFTDTADTTKQLTVLVVIDHRNQAVTHFHAQRVFKLHISPGGFGRGRRFHGFCDAARRFDILLRLHLAATHKPQQTDYAGTQHEDARIFEQLPDHLLADVLVGCHARHDNTRRVRFLSHFGATTLRFIFANQTRIQVGVDSHLLTRHPVKHKARTHFGDTARTFGDNHKVDDHQDDKHHDPDGEVSANQEVAKGFHHPSRRRGTGMPFQQNNTRRGYVQRQAQQGRKQQNGGKGRKLQRALGKHGDQQHHNRQGNVKGKQQIKDKRR